MKLRFNVPHVSFTDLQLSYDPLSGTLLCRAEPLSKVLVRNGLPGLHASGLDQPALVALVLDWYDDHKRRGRTCTIAERGAVAMMLNPGQPRRLHVRWSSPQDLCGPALVGERKIALPLRLSSAYWGSLVRNVRAARRTLGQDRELGRRRWA